MAHYAGVYPWTIGRYRVDELLAVYEYGKACLERGVV